MRTNVCCFLMQPLCHVNCLSTERYEDFGTNLKLFCYLLSKLIVRALLLPNRPNTYVSIESGHVHECIVTMFAEHSNSGCCVI